MKIVFLDIDGVLNGHDFDQAAMSTRIQYRCVKQLNRIIRATDCKFVLSSAWRYMLLKLHRSKPPAMSLAGFEYMMRTHGTCGFKLLGTTGPDEAFGWCANNDIPVRGLQIQAWLKGHGEVESYIAIDDDDLDISPLGIPLVKTHPRWGLGRNTASLAIRILNQRIEAEA